MNTQTRYETGATSHAVNDIILFLDNTKALAERKDFIYNKYAVHDQFKPKLKNPIGSIKQEFIDVLLHYAKNRYVVEFPNKEDHQHILSLSKEQEKEFSELYFEDFQRWLKENGFESWTSN